MSDGRFGVKRRLNAVCAELFAAFQDICDPLRGWPPPPLPDDLDRVGTDWLDRALLVVAQAENMDVLAKTAMTPMPWFEAFEADAS